jgi:phage-related protein
MTTFLAWVYAQANKVYDWFGNAYYDLKNAAANAWNWAVSQASAAYTAARNYAYSLLLSVQGGITSSIDWLLNKISEVRNSLLEDIAGLFDWVEYKFNSIRDLVSDVVWDVLGNINEFVNDVRNEIINILNQTSDWLYGWVNDNFGWVNDLRGAITDIINLFSVDVFMMLVNFVTTWRDAILNFFSNPVSFILDVIQDKFIGFMSYVLAWALGTTKYDLPKNQPWKD